MDQESVIKDIEERARQARVPLYVLCSRAGVHPSTFSRWKKTPRNSEPKGASMLNIERLYAALDQIEAQRSAPARKAARA